MAKDDEKDRATDKAPDGVPGDVKPVKRRRAKKPVLPALTPDGEVATPDKVRDESDPGDDMQRRLRYQHAYGLILLVGASSGRLKYTSIWCEHHDDFLASDDGFFDSFQVKTAFPERGPWDLTSEGLLSALKKFVSLESRFPGKIRRFHFVSNVYAFDTAESGKLAKSPVQLLEAIKTATTPQDLKEPFVEALRALAEKLEVDPRCLFVVLKRVSIVKGPSLDDFEASLIVDHLDAHPECRGLTPRQIAAIRDEIIQRINDASSLNVTDPAKHWYCLSSMADDPWITAKRIDVSEISETIRHERPVPFRFSPANSRLNLKRSEGGLSTFEKKLLKGGLGAQLETMRRRTVSAERHLLELALRKGDDFENIRNQLECLVQGICDDAHLGASQTTDPFGRDMLREVQARLRHIADNDAGMTFGERYDCLVGIAGLLTEACSVWWSPAFDLGEAI